MAEDGRGERIDDKAALLAGGDDAGGFERAEVMGDVGDGGVEGAGDLADGFGALLEALNDLEAVGVSDGLQESGTFLGFESITHG